MLLGAFFGAVLGFVQLTVENQVVAKYSPECQRSILYTVGIETEESSESEVSRLFRQHFKEKKSMDHEYLIFIKNGEIAGYCFPFSGKGMWGTIDGYLAVDQKLDQIMGVAFTEMLETPGLGARIMEVEFTDQFRSIDITGQKVYISIDNGDGNGIDSISGATLTVDAVVQTLNEAIDEIKLIGKEGLK